MKICPKCGAEHNQSGKCCSQKCAHSRTFTAESLRRKAEKQKRIWQDPEYRKQREEVVAKYWEDVRTGERIRATRVVPPLTSEVVEKKLVARGLSSAQVKQVAETASTAEEAAKTLGLSRTLYKYFAEFLGCYRINPGRKGLCYTPEEKLAARQAQFQKVLAGGYTAICGAKYKSILIDVGLKEDRCEVCGLGEWQGRSLACQLHHKDGDSTNNALDNVQILCPNCHSQTPNYGSHNKISYREKKACSRCGRMITSYNLDRHERVCSGKTLPASPKG